MTDVPTVDVRAQAMEAVGSWHHLDPTTWKRQPYIGLTIDALVAQPEILADLQRLAAAASPSERTPQQP